MRFNLPNLKEVFNRDRLNNQFGWILVIIGPLILFGPMLIRGQALFWGTPILQFVPWRIYAFEVLNHGFLPLWNPYLGMGAPLFANYQIALVYPPNILLHFVGLIWGHGLLVALHLIWAGLGMYILARRLGLGMLSQVLAGMAFSLSGYLVARSNFLSINATAAWLPWIIIAADRLVQVSREVAGRGKLLQATCLLSITIAFQWLAGHAQTAWYTAVALGAWILWRLIGNVNFKKSLQILAYFALAAFFAFMLCAIQLLPTIEYTLHSQRADTLDADYALSYSFWPWRILGLVFPDLFGSPASGDYWGYGNYWEDAIYFGVLPFLLSIYALVSGWRRRSEHQHLIKFLTILGCTALILALGNNTPIYSFLFEYVLTFELFQAPTRWNIIFVFTFALLSAIGLDQLRRPSGRALYWTRLGTAGAGIIGVATLAAGEFLGNIEASFLRAFIIAGIWFVTSGLLMLLKPDDPSLRWDFMVSAIVLIDLLLAGRGLIPSVSPSMFTDPNDELHTLAKDHRVYMDSGLEKEFKFVWTHRFDTYLNTQDWDLVRKYGLPNTTLMDGIPSANNFDPILPQRYVLWMKGLEDTSNDHRVRLLSLMDVGWRAVIDSTDEMSLTYREVPNPKRVRWISRSIPVNSSLQAFELVMDPAFDPDEIVVLEYVFTQEDVAVDTQGRVEIVETDNPNLVTIVSSAPSDGWIVLSDVWFPGWRASVDGVPTEILHADFLFRAVRVPAGEHQVRFEYRPASFQIGLYMSVLACTLLILQGWRWLRD